MLYYLFVHSATYLIMQKLTREAKRAEVCSPVRGNLAFYAAQAADLGKVLASATRWSCLIFCRFLISLSHSLRFFLLGINSRGGSVRCA